MNCVALRQHESSFLAIEPCVELYGSCITWDRKLMGIREAVLALTLKCQDAWIGRALSHYETS